MTVEKIEKLKLRGVKLNSDAAQLHCADIDDATPCLSHLLKILKDNKINILSLSKISAGNSFNSCLYFDAKDIKQVENLANNADILKGRVGIVGRVGALSVFPHQNSMQTLGVLLFAIGNAGISLLSMSCSLSTLTFVVDCSQLEKTSAAVMEYADIS